MTHLYKLIYPIEFAIYLYRIMEICADMHHRYKCDLLLNLGVGNFILLRADCEMSYTYQRA